MSDRQETAPIAAPNPRAFFAAYAFWETAFIGVLAVVFATHPSVKMRVVVLLLALVPLYGTARWVGRSTDAGTLFLRSMGMHAISPLLPILVHVLTGDTGTAHGGPFLWIIVLVPYGGAVCAVLGLMAAVTSLLVMRSLQRRGAGAEPER